MLAARRVGSTRPHSTESQDSWRMQINLTGRAEAASGWRVDVRATPEAQSTRQHAMAAFRINVVTTWAPLTEKSVFMIISKS
jgi:hypothetical protein